MSSSATRCRRTQVAHENVHAGLASRAKSHVILQDDEAPIRYFHKVLEDHCGFYRNA